MSETFKMIITTSAEAKLKELCREDQTIVIGVKGGGCAGFEYSMEIKDKPSNAEDFWGQALSHLTYIAAGRIFSIHKSSLLYLNGVTLDFVDGLMGGFKFENPNASTNCGCGKSFGIRGNQNE